MTWRYFGMIGLPVILFALSSDEKEQPHKSVNGTVAEWQSWQSGAITEDVAKLVDGKCSICMREHQRSTVVINGYWACSSVSCGSPYYDEDGKYHTPTACNTCVKFGRCSRDHKVRVEIKI